MFNDETAPTAKLRLEGQVDVRCAEDMRMAAIELLAANKPVRVDCSKLTHLDLSVLQILLALRLGLKRHDLYLDEIPESVRTIVQHCGLADHLVVAH